MYCSTCVMLLVAAVPIDLGLKPQASNEALLSARVRPCEAGRSSCPEERQGDGTAQR